MSVCVCVCYAHRGVTVKPRGAATSSRGSKAKLFLCTRKANKWKYMQATTSLNFSSHTQSQLCNRLSPCSGQTEPTETGRVCVCVYVCVCEEESDSDKERAEENERGENTGSGQQQDETGPGKKVSAFSQEE